MAKKHNKSKLTFDIGTAEEVFTCAACHTGGGPYEYDRNGNRLDSIDPNKVPKLDGDYYTYSTSETQHGSWKDPHKFDWHKSGSLEGDCMICHLDPDAKRVKDANGVQPIGQNPRLRIFALRKSGKVQQVSLGIYPGQGWTSAFNYSDPLSRSKTKFEKGKYYADIDNPMAEVRNYMHAPYVEGQGDYYTRVPAKREFLGYFFRWSPSANLMGLDNNQDGYPVTYIKIVKQKNEFVPEVYYEANEFDSDDEISIPILSSKATEDGSNKWTRTCGQCHVGTKDPINGFMRIRTWGIGLKADIVKRAELWNLDPKTEKDPGYDVHAAAGLECTSCHSKGKPDSVDWEDYVTDADHNFLKGDDSGNMVRNDLDNNPPPKNCQYCHLKSGDGPDPTDAHQKLFGSATAKHIKEIACQTCHIPDIRYWTFRTYDYSLGFNVNFDNRHFPKPTGGMMNVTLPPYYAPAPFYGLGNGSLIVNQTNTDDLSMDMVSPVANMNLDQPNDPYGMMYQKMTGKKGFDWAPPMYYYKGMHGIQIMVGNPVTVITWRDKTMDKVLYPKEFNAAVKQIAMDRKGRMYALLITGDKIYDKTGYMGHPDMKPEISTLDDVKKMRKALIKVLKKEGEKNPDPALYIAAHFFKMSHNVAPADQALGANGTCSVCHGENGRIENRIVVFSPNSIQGFNEGVKQGLILVDPEISFVKPIDLDGDKKADILGSTEKDMLRITKEHMEEISKK